MAILYPVATNAELALGAPAARAAREREAVLAAGAPVRFVVEETGPAFASREAALDAYAGRLEDDRPGARATVAPEDRWCGLREVVDPAVRRHRPARIVRPLKSGPRRWPEPRPGPAVVWRLSVAYWKVEDPAAMQDLPQARAIRRGRAAAGIERRVLDALASQPLRPDRPQKGLDLGLFEQRLPEAPDRVIADD
ncbi:MAG TPA: hypothetical protein VGB49_01725 [Caulobacteraceae bacterium]